MTTSSSEVLRTKMLILVSARTSRSNTKLMPEVREITSNTDFSVASRNSSVMGLVNGDLSSGGSLAVSAPRPVHAAARRSRGAARAPRAGSGPARARRAACAPPRPDPPPRCPCAPAHSTSNLARVLERAQSLPVQRALSGSSFSALRYRSSAWSSSTGCCGPCRLRRCTCSQRTRGRARKSPGTVVVGRGLGRLLPAWPAPPSTSPDIISRRPSS